MIRIVVVLVVIIVLTVINILLDIFCYKVNKKEHAFLSGN